MPASKIISKKIFTFFSCWGSHGRIIAWRGIVFVGYPGFVLIRTVVFTIDPYCCNIGNGYCLGLDEDRNQGVELLTHAQDLKEQPH
jgi:hypothetical protein